MPRFFCKEILSDTAVISGDDAGHISRSLRMKAGDEIILCDKKGFDYFCIIKEISDIIACEIIKKEQSKSEPDIKVTLFQALPKADKLELIIQKSVELGVCEIVPVLTKRCVSRPDEKAMAKKLERFSKISLEAAKQSGRGIVPKIGRLISFAQTIEALKSFDTGIIFYEGGGKSLSHIDFTNIKSAGIFIGPEGGFEPDEVNFCEKSGIIRASLGPRILRCETAPLAALSIIMNITENM
ncbi:MAG: RsmE family RNA methyltransferase [Oscillospiraceae bacterium]